MKERTVPAVAGIPASGHEHLLEPLFERARTAPDAPMLSIRVGDAFVPITAAEVADRVRRLAKGLMALGVMPGDRVALMSRTRHEWLLLDYAILSAGGVTVPIYETSSMEQVHWIVSDSGAHIVLLETPEMAASFEEIASTLPDCRHVLVLDAGGLEELGERAEGVSDDELDARTDALTTEDVATIIYTSGTTGRPKGCVLTHGNLRSNARQSLVLITPMLREGDKTLLFLPLAHSLAKIIALTTIEGGKTLGFATDMKALAEELSLLHPSYVVSVPRVFETIFNGIQRKLQQEGKGAIFDRAADVASRWSQAQMDGHLGIGLRLQHAAFDRLVYRKLRAVFGGELRFAVSGGGPLGARLTHFFNGIGIQVLEGYGLTETSPTTNLNVDGSWVIGSVGRPVPGTSIAVDESGEVLVKGPQVFQGYWNNDVATAEVFDGDGWFHTGDLGEFDDAGFLRITGRAKDLIVTAGGKNVAPAPLEDRLRGHPLISQAMVVGDARPFVAALIAIDSEAFALWAADHGRADATVAELVDDADLRAEVQRAIDDANRMVSRAEAIKKFVILPHDLSIEGGELTPTLKVKRNVLVKEYGSVIDRLYTA